MDERKPQVPSPHGIYPNTCVTCKCNLFSSNIPQCVNCLKLDKDGDRFPLWEKE
jgi:hypothetical protein